MKDQHRATDSEWYCIKARTCGDKGDQVAYSTIHELLCRIEALEATQHAHVDLSHLSDDKREKILKLLANPDRFEVLEVAQPAKPDSSLVDRVVSAMCGGTEWQARAAIRAVAAWLRNHYGEETATTYVLEQEAEG